MSKRALLITAAAVLAGALAATTPNLAATTPPPAATTTAAVPMNKDGGVYVVPVNVNGLATFDCIVDSGASDVNIPEAVFRKLERAGSVTEADYVGTQDYTLADGSSSRGRTYRIKSLKVGNVVVHNVIASVGGDESSGLLGQSFLERFRSWSLNNTNHTLVLSGPPNNAPVAGPKPTGPVTGPHPNDGPVSVAQGGPSRPLPAPPASHRLPPSTGGAVGDVAQGGAVGRRDPSDDDQLTAQHSQ
ncbi:MAG: retroviral-like aspartic protease family protein [Alphaproteobacteria bacterium]|nr:retroviral-like aspartic protease family protein [Alphaproteobacteria bacterium]MBL6938258.1 retroviral-like aspartic protease family protein [Alphaproteobacteria bacterium]MBL7097314.1 retroviral-like aspartic protease family protein [Alphaproteobacteria bacterium]